MGRTTEKAAAKAARQLLLHQERIRWMASKMDENAAILETHLIATSKDADILPGGYTVERTAEGVSVGRITASGGYEQLALTV